MNPRWHDWVIAAAITALAAIGVAALWGQEIAAVLDPAENSQETDPGSVRR
ncbi:MAG: hypothetical protein KJO07_18875 [Deltaproteobacteria bacterium]|nr:hypothetical protein [Deltaproteobacteria bacterium]